MLVRNMNTEKAKEPISQSSLAGILCTAPRTLKRNISELMEGKAKPGNSLVKVTAAHSFAASVESSSPGSTGGSACAAGAGDCLVMPLSWVPGDTSVDATNPDSGAGAS